jgi:hypothetical protein
VHKEFVPAGQAVNSGFCCDVLRQLRENVRRRRPERWLEQTWLLHHDNAPSHTSVFTQKFLAKHKMTVILHPPYSPVLAPCDFFLLPKMKLNLKGRRFDTIEDIRVESQGVLDTVIEKDFQEEFQKWRTRWDFCLHTSRVMAADRLYGEFYVFYVSPEYFGYTLVKAFNKHYSTQEESRLYMLCSGLLVYSFVLTNEYIIFTRFFRNTSVKQNVSTPVGIRTTATRLFTHRLVTIANFTFFAPSIMI